MSPHRTLGSPDTTRRAGPFATLANAAPVAAWMSGALFAFCGLAIAMRGLAPHADVFEANAVRTGGGLAAVVAFMAATGRRPAAHDGRNVRDLVVRNAVHWGASLLWTLSVTLLPLATVFSIEFTAPVWVALISAALLGVRLGPVTAAGLVGGFVGVLVVVRPDAASLVPMVAVPGLGIHVPTVLVPVATAAGLGVSALLTKRLTLRNATTDVVLWMMALQFAANLSVVAGKSELPGFLAKFTTTGPFAGYATLLVGCGLASQVCLTQALRRGSPVVVTSIDFMRIPLVSLLAYALYGETLDWRTFAGSAVIVGAVLAITWDGERRKARDGGNDGTGKGVGDPAPPPRAPVVPGDAGVLAVA